MTRGRPFVLLMLLVAACGDSPTSPDDAATTTATVSPTVFEGTLELNASNFYSFTVSQSGSVTAYLASLTPVGRREALAVPVSLGVGVPKGEVPLGIGVGVPGPSGGGCRAAVSLTAAPHDAPQLTTAVEQGTFCVLIFDVGGIVDPIPFTVQLVHP